MTTANVIRYTATPRQARKWVEMALRSGLVPFLQSSPGLGKSSLMRLIAKQWGLKLIDHRLSTSDPTDLSGLPDTKGRKATFLPFDLFPVEGDELPAGYDGWMIFLDEFNSAHKDVQAAAYKLILDRMVGQHKLHERVVIACAGNLSTDRAITNELSTAMQSRVVHIEMVHSFKEWLEDVAIPGNYDRRVIAFLNSSKSSLMDFRPEHDDHTFDCPRTWEFVNNLCQNIPLSQMEDYQGLFAGTISSGTATSFVQFCRVFENIPTFREIIADPEGTPITSDGSTRWAIVTMLLEDTTESTLEKVHKYVDRLSTEFRVLFYRALLVKHPKLRENPIMAKAIINLSHYLRQD